MMDMKNLNNIPPWEWPASAGRQILDTLRINRADASERFLAVELAGDFTVICDELADVLLAIIADSREPDELRGRAAISLGPALETADIEEFEDPEDVPITEAMFYRIQETLYRLYQDEDTPKLVRRRILEASVRAPQDWHQAAVHEAYASDDEEWQLTAVFCMQFIRGFDKQIIESLSSRKPEIFYEAVCAAGNWGIDAAWPQIASLVTTRKTEKGLLLAAIEAAAIIRPGEAAEILGPLLESDDEDIVDAVYEALALTGQFLDEDDDEDAPTLH